MSRVGSFSKLVKAAYFYFIALSATWFGVSYFEGHYVNFLSLLVLIGLVLQLKYQVKLVNLLLGILLLVTSIYGFLWFMGWGGKAGFDTFIYTMMALGAVSTVASGIIAFGYIKQGE